MRSLSSGRNALASAGRIVVAAGALAALAACGGGATSPLAAAPPPAVLGTVSAEAAVTMGAFTVADAVSGDTSTAPLTLTWHNGAPATGDMLVACAESQWGNVPQTPAGWTALASNGSGFGTALFYRVAAAGEPSTVAFGIPSPFNIAASMIRVKGAAATKPLWSHAANASATIATAPLTPSVAGMLPVACFGAVGSGTQSVASGWTLGSQYAATYASLIEDRAPTTDASTPVTVSSTDASTPQTNDAYGLLLAPATAATPAPPAGGSAAFSVLDQANGATSNAPLVLPWLKGAPAAGDLLVACVESQYNTLPTAPAGWTPLYDNAGGFGTGLFYKIAGGGEASSVTFTIPTPYNIAAAMLRVGGAAATAPVWSHAGPVGGSSVTTAALVPAASSLLPIACFAGIGSGTRTVPAGWTVASQSASGGYSAAVADASTLTTAGTPVSVTATDAASATVNDAYALLAAPAAGSSSNGVTLAPSSIDFLTTSGAPIAVTAAQNGNTSFSIGASTCAGIATIGAAGAATFNVAPAGIGRCSITIAGSNGATGTLAITTTSTVLTIK